MTLTRTFRVSGLLTAGGVLFVTLAHGKGGWAAFGIVLLVFACPVFWVSAVP